MMDDNQRFDDILFSVLKDCKTLPTFLDSIFGFLNRRTDFYLISEKKNSPVGLPDGLAERLVRNTFYKWKPKELEFVDNVPEAVTETIVETSTIEEITSDLNKTTFQNESKSEIDFTSSESYNGAVRENYSWSQTINEIDIIVKIPENITPKNLIVTILPQKLSIKLKSDKTPILEGELCQKCKHSDALWSLHKERLEIHLEKSLEMWWDCLLKNEPKLDVSKIDCSRPFEELSEEAQAKIQELTWNQERKRLGLPTSDELKLQEKLRQGWNAEGSPFTGPYDTKAVTFN